MRGLLVSLAFFVLFFLMMPFILSVVAFVVLFAFVLILLTRLGLLPGVTYRRYTTTTKPRPHQTRAKTVFVVDNDPPQADKNGWFQSEQEGEVITLPETALKKDDGESPPSS